MSVKRFKILQETTAYQGYFSLKTLEVQHTLYAGGWSPPLKREVFHRGNCVAVLLYDPLRDVVVVLEQFRVGALQYGDERAWLLEIVAGAVEAGETPEEVAYREAREEAGCEILALLKINEFFTSPGGTSELLTLYVGMVDAHQVGGIHGLAEEHEDIAVTTMPFDAVYDLLESGRIISAIPIIAVQWLKIHRQNLRKRWLIPEQD